MKDFLLHGWFMKEFLLHDWFMKDYHYHGSSRKGSLLQLLYKRHNATARLWGDSPTLKSPCFTSRLWRDYQFHGLSMEKRLSASQLVYEKTNRFTASLWKDSSQLIYEMHPASQLVYDKTFRFTVNLSLFMKRLLASHLIYEKDQSFTACIWKESPLHSPTIKRLPASNLVY